MRMIPYLNFAGQCAEAFRYYERILGGTLEIVTHGDAPIADQVPSDWHELVMNACLTTGDAVLMGSDAPPGQPVNPQGVHVAIQVDDPAEAERIFGELGEGGRVTMPITNTFWAERFGMLVDRYGISWLVNGGPK